MFALAAYGLWSNIKSQKVKGESSGKILAKQQAVWGIFLIIICLPLVIVAVMAIVQALPGSFLCQTLCGVGYYIGLNITGNMIVGYVFAFAGLGMSVAAWCYIVFLVAYFYNKFENLEIFETLKQSIKLIVGGLLLNTSLSLFTGIADVFVEEMWQDSTAVLLTLALLGATWLVKWKSKIPNIILILVSGAITVAVFNLI